MIQIPLFIDSSADFTQTIDIDNVIVTIRLTFNIRNQFFRMNLSTENNELYGLKVKTNFPLIYHHKALFPELDGDFFVNQVTNQDEEIDFTYDNFGSVYLLLYYSAEELQAWKDANGI